MNKTLFASIMLIVLLALSLWIGQKNHQHSMSAQGGGAMNKFQQIYSDPNVFRTSLVEAIREAGNWNAAEQEEHFRNMFKAGLHWDQVLKEKEAILTEALGPGYKDHPKIKELEIMVLFDLGQLSFFRHESDIQAIRAGQLR